ncbi:hypothetical protein P170DRAFT_513115 [Aspergillus steynii IBT 23096]|uniref:Uncharacterized protein n=1 Tax=Aspergillus steynii IBT 23096 TaxID=1392250 RepID=A0A2I2FWN2_9EURO|nr:uncharacterized protein P170DRAFT_513115 [Aspergillus steynii IBT 23096]PLB45038.1 hypothetical protein P170DRAFT_513115 [Aspergillus steynii IBT 23096]
MSVPDEDPERKEMRKSLRSLERHVTGLKPDHQIAPSEIDRIQLMPLSLDEGSKDRPVFFTPLDESFLETPDDEYDQKYGMEYDTYDSIPEDCRDPKTCAQAINIYWSTYLSRYSLGKQPVGGEIVWSPVRIGYTVYKDLYRYGFPEFGFTDAEQVKTGPYAHMKATIYNNLNGDDDHLLQGEMLPILRLMIGHLRRARFIDHMVAPLMVFSFLGPQHARVIEAYVEDHTVVVRRTKLYDLRSKDAAAFKLFARWFFGKPGAPTGQSQ